MLEQMKAVSNPLTIIGLFCGVVEVAGLIVIGAGNIAPEAQRDLIRFVIWFPVGLVLLFFITLWFKDRVLYAPSDFRDEQNYLALATANVKQSLDIKKIEKMIATAKTEIIGDVQRMIPVTGAGEKNKVEEIVNEKLQPVQAAVEDIKSNPARNFYLSRTPESTERIMNLILTTLHNEGKPLTVNEIAAKNGAPITLLQSLLAVLADMRLVNAVRGEDGKTRFVIAE
jgi:hypothetical protein